MKLTATRIKHLTTPGLHGDGGNLWLRVTETGNQSWVFRYSRHGKARVMGLGSLDLVPLGEARQLAVEARKLLFPTSIPWIVAADRAAALAAHARTTTLRTQPSNTSRCSNSWTPAHHQACRIRCVTTPCR